MAETAPILEYKCPCCGAGLPFDEKSQKIFSLHILIQILTPVRTQLFLINHKLFPFFRYIKQKIKSCLYKVTKPLL